MGEERKLKTQESPENKHCVHHPLSGGGNPDHPLNRSSNQRGWLEAFLMCSLRAPWLSEENGASSSCSPSPISKEVAI